MNPIIVTVKFDRNKTTCDPKEVTARPGDSVQWICHEGDLALDFGEHNPFTIRQTWRAARGELTPAAIVKSNPQGGTVIRPAISINGNVVAESLGDFRIQP